MTHNSRTPAYFVKYNECKSQRNKHMKNIVQVNHTTSFLRGGLTVNRASRQINIQAMQFKCNST